MANSSDIDYFGFNGYAGEAYWIQVKSTETLPMVKLLNPDGEILAEGAYSPFFGNIELKWDAPRKVLYHIEITVPSSGHYALVIFNIDPVDDHGHDFPSATHVDIDQTTGGFIN